MLKTHCPYCNAEHKITKEDASSIKLSMAECTNCHKVYAVQFKTKMMIEATIYKIEETEKVEK